MGMACLPNTAEFAAITESISASARNGAGERAGSAEITTSSSLPGEERESAPSGFPTRVHLSQLYGWHLHDRSRREHLDRAGGQVEQSSMKQNSNCGAKAEEGQRASLNASSRPSGRSTDSVGNTAARF